MSGINYQFGLLVLLVTPVLWAVDYVPPPTGPYQTSVIINKNDEQYGNNGQVYRFPSDSLIQTNQAETVPEVNQLADTVVQPKPAAIDIFKKPDIPTAPPQTPVMPNIPGLAGQAGNPWAVDTLTYPNTYQGNWNTQQYPVPQQYPYGYNNQNNFMSDPFNGMPMPWNTMPMQPFFSGR